MVGSFLKQNKTDRGTTALLFGWFCVGLLMSLPNLGGEGLNLPQNILTWTMMGVIILWNVIQKLDKNINSSCKLIHAIQQNTKILPSGTEYIIIGVVLWTLPLFWSPHLSWVANAFPRVIAVWIALGFYLYLVTETPCSKLRQPWLVILALSAVIQTIYSLWQIFFFGDLPGGRPYGIFQQVNVLASFISTGLACALWINLNSRRQSYRLISCISFVFLPALLVILQSRAGYIGASISVLILSISHARHNIRRLLQPMTLITIGIVSGMIWKYYGNLIFPQISFPIVDKDSSNHYRIYMLKLTWQLIMEHPFIGNGYGSFESIFGNLAQISPPGLEAATVLYPHNEILYTWVEGGVTALCGIMLIGYGFFKRLYNKGALGASGVALFVPIAVHMNLEYPLYQSTTHMLVLVMLLLVSGPRDSRERVVNYNFNQLTIKKRDNSIFWHASVGVMSITLIVYMLTGLITQQRITFVEQRGLIPFVINEKETMASFPNVLLQNDRIEFDRHVAMLLRYNTTHDVLLLQEFWDWGKKYLLVHNDPSVYASMVQIARAQNSPKANQICISAHGRWPEDQRFICE